VPRKNIRPFHGKSIIAYSIQTAIDSDLFDDVLVSTDDDEIGRIAEQYGAGYLKRSADMAQDHVGTQEVMADAMRRVPCDYAVCLYATAPLLLPQDIDRCVSEVRFKYRNFAMTVGAEPLRDAGACYAGRGLAFQTGMPLIDTSTAMVPLPENRICDINTEDDWLRAERMYAALHGLEMK
jgi:N-acylneuraminate cytidylyltransferase